MSRCGAATFQTLQINVGRKCNQTCTHCHVDAGPHRTEMMDEDHAHKVGAWIAEHRPDTVDITGGAPELSAYFRYFVETARARRLPRDRPEQPHHHRDGAHA